MGLPPLHDAWATSLLAAPPPDETRATCDRCVMCKDPSDPADARDAAAFYDPRTKCCTYVPHLPNFLVGRILRETDPRMQRGVQRVAARVAGGVAVTPLGVSPPFHDQALYRTAKTTGFGRALALRCPYYVEESGGCGIWLHRNGTCATWFCKYDRGALGQQLWRALDRLFAVVEHELAVHCALELGLDDEATHRLIAHSRPDPSEPSAPDARELDDQRPPDYDALWGGWSGREPAFYRACADLVDAMSWRDVLAVAGAQARLEAAGVVAAHRALASDELPAALRAGAFKTRVASAGTVCLEGYSARDELAAPSVLLPVLAHFDGRPVAEVLHEVEAETGVSMEPAFVRRLVDFEILVPLGRRS